MKKRFLLTAIRKNGLLVYKNEKKKEMVIRKRNDFENEAEFEKTLISFTSKEEAEAFIKENKLASIEVIEVEE